MLRYSSQLGSRAPLLPTLLVTSRSQSAPFKHLPKLEDAFVGMIRKSCVERNWQENRQKEIDESLTVEPYPLPYLSATESG